MKVTKIFSEFFQSEKAGGLILIICSLASLGLANSALSADYTGFFHANLINRPVVFWINDGLMTIFFLLVGLEIEREIYIGELSDFKSVMLPVMAAFGGMLFPAAIHFGLNVNTPYQKGFGIPMATDIAFSLGILSLLGSRVPASIKVFLAALAIIDDLGAIIIIAVFYSAGVSFPYLGGALLTFVIMIILNRSKFRMLAVYLMLGMVMWLLMYKAGVHPTISGVLLAFAIPFGSGDEQSPSYKVEHYLQKVVPFVILPLFAIANTAIIFPPGIVDALVNTNSIGIILGLLLGKPLGILTFTFLAKYLGIGTIPEDLQLKDIFGVGLLAGIGFTMSIFITLIAFQDQFVITGSKLAILIASVLAGTFGYMYLRYSFTPLRKQDVQ
jgi:NhaA family Na+:H+ antiporter